MATKVYSCKVLWAGTVTDNDQGLAYVQVKLVSGDAFGPNGLFFHANPICQREMLQTALTAIAGDFNLVVTLPDPVKEYDGIENMWVVRPYPVIY